MPAAAQRLPSAERHGRANNPSAKPHIATADDTSLLGALPIAAAIVERGDDKQLVITSHNSRFYDTVRQSTCVASDWNQADCLKSGPISELILDLHQWLAGFDPASLLELDYATLCDFMTWDELDDDRSSRDLHEALDALEREEYPRSADIYQGVLTHWAEIRSREIMN